MAWRKCGTLAELILTINGQDISFTNFVGGTTIVEEDAAMFSNPYSGSVISHSAYSDSTPDLFARLNALAPGTIDLDVYLYQLNLNDYMYLWSAKLGRSFNIQFKRIDTNRFLYQLNVYGTLSAGLEFLGDRAPSLPKPPYGAIGFLIDDDNQQASLWTARGWTRKEGATVQSTYRYLTPGYGTASAGFKNALYNFLIGQEIEPTPGGGDPYEPGGTSTSGGGENATFDLTSDNINVPTLPTISASGAGLLTLYQVSLQNMHDFANYLWSPLFDVDTLKKLFNDPMDAIISLGMLPFTPTGGTVSNIFIGESDSGVSASRLGSQYYELDMGSLTLDTFYDSALDLNPYTKVDLYLPYCGTVSINPDEFDGKSIHVVYHVDILTGACVVFVEDGARVLVQSQGNILTAIPFTSKDFKSIFGAVLGDAAAAGAALFALPTGGISAAAAVGIVGGAAMNSVNSKLNMPHGGQCASTAGFLSIQKPYLIITRPAQCLPEDNAAYQGYPAYITATVGDLSGFIKISEAHFDGFTCTDGELQEIDRLLKEGVYVQ